MNHQLQPGSLTLTIKLLEFNFTAVRGNIKFHINSVSIQLYDQLFLIFFKTKLLMINLKMEHCGAFYAPSYHIC